MIIDFILDYITEEKISNYISIIIATFVILFAFIFLFIIKYSFFKGMAISFLIIGLIYIIVGITNVLQLPKLLEKIENNITYDAEKIKTEEIQRVEVILKNNIVYKWIEIFSFCIALFIYFMFYKSSQTFWKGLALGFLIPLGIFFTIHSFSNVSSENYLQNLKNYKIEIDN